MVRDLINSEPAVVIGSLVSILQFVLESVAGASSWKAAVPALVGAVIRRFVSPA